jgi:rubredoxin
MPGNRAWRDIEAAQAATRIVRLHLERRLTDDDPDVARIYLDRLVTSLTDAAVRVERHIPNPEADLLRARSRDTPDDPGCPSCARGLDSQDRPIYSPSKRESRGACGLCGWCYHEVEKTAEHLGIPARTAAGDQRYWPIAKAVEAHSRGEMITAGKIRSWAKTIDRDEREREKRRAHKQKLKRRYGR